MKPVNMRPYHHGNLPTELVRVGLELASEGGASAIKLREVARRAGVSPAAAYRHFGSQEDLINAVKADALTQLTQAMAAEVNALSAEATADEKLRAAALGYFRFAVNSNNLYAALMETVDSVPHMDAAVLPKVTQDFAAVEERFPADSFPFTYILKLLSETNIQRADLVEVTLSLWSAIHGVSTLCGTGGLRNEPKEHKRKLFEITMNAMFSGLNI